MKISIVREIREKIKRFPSGVIFGYETFEIGKTNEMAVAKALGRLLKEGKIRRASKGKYYKPKQTKFGEIRPSGSEILKVYLKDGPKNIGYITGTSLYNRMGLTSQIPHTIEIATESPKSPKQIEGYKIKFVKSVVPVTEARIPYLELLDVLKNVNKIPGVSPDEALKRIVAKVAALKQVQIDKLVDLAMAYNAATRALLGAVLEHYCKDYVNSNKLFKTLNLFTIYKIKIDDKLLPNKSKWAIK